MKKNITYLCMAAAALLVSSCTQNEEITPTIENEGKVPVLFTAKNIVTLETKADGKWFGNQDMGISMLSADNQTLIETNVHFRPEEYITGEVSLIPYTGGYTLYYPTDGSNVQFNAYVPYRTVTDNIVTWNFSTEGDVLFYTATTEGDGKTYNESTGVDQPVSLAFKHRLAKILIDVESTEDEYDVNNVTGTLSNQPVSFDYNVLTNDIKASETKQPLNAKPMGNQLKFAILPEALTQPETVTINLPNGTSFEATLTPPQDGFKAGIWYKYKTTLTKPKTPGTLKATIEASEEQEMGPLTSEEVQVEP